MIYLEIILNLPINQGFTYSYTPPADEKPELVPMIGKRAEIMFGNKKTEGFIIGITNEIPPTCKVDASKIKPIRRVIDKEPLFGNELIEIANWISRYYLCTLGEAVFSMIPSGRRESSAGGFGFEDEISAAKKNELSDEQKKCVEEINDTKALYHYIYEPTGTGKTETVYQLAKQTGRDIYQVDYSQLRSKWVGDSEKNVKAMFDEYRHLCKGAKRMPILLLNEADALIGKRLESAERAVDKGENAIQNIVLQEMENFDGILIATTNLTGNIDSAFGRRFLYKIEFEKPDMATRARIWRSMLPSLNNGDATVLSESFPLFSGGQIENVTRKVTVNEVLHGGVTKLDDIIILCEHETMDNSHKGGKSIGFQIR